MFGVPWKGLQSNYGKLMEMVLESFLLKSLTLFDIAQFRAMMQ
jgi:polyhydroxyalkanoate synthesis regulator protein